MDLDKLVADLKEESERLGRAIAALLGSALARGGKKTRAGRPRGTSLKRQQARRPDSRRQKAVVNRDEEALGRAQEEGFVANCSNRREDMSLRCARELAAPIGRRRLQPSAS